MPEYAKGTKVPVTKTESEIRQLLDRYRADSVMLGFEQTGAVIGFKMNDRVIRFNLPLPDRNAKEFKETDSGRWLRSEAGQRAAWEGACRQRWRALKLAIQAKLEAVECGITTFEEEFLAHIVTPSGETVGKRIIPALGELLEDHAEPRRLLEGRK